MKSFLDLLKDDMISSQTIGNLTFEGVFWALILSLIAGVIIYSVYKFSYAGVMFINNFAITLIGLTMITCLIILTITSNLLLSLGMVGALSIVRFRTAIKEPIDMIYMFWAIAMGVAIGAGFFMLASVGMLFLSVVLYSLSRFSNHSDLYIVVVRHEKIDRQQLEKIFRTHTKSFKFRAEIHLSATCEMTYELRMKQDTYHMIDGLKTDMDIQDVSLVSYNTNTLM